jgi:hypothetical protein
MEQGDGGSGVGKGQRAAHRSQWQLLTICLDAWLWQSLWACLDPEVLEQDVIISWARRDALKFLQRTPQ